MNRAMNRITTLVIACAAASAALAQDRVAVPLSSPSQPATVKARLISGSITVTAGSGSEVVVETQASARPGRERVTPPPPPGMHQIDVGGRGFSVEEDHNVVTVIPDMRGGRNVLNIRLRGRTGSKLGVDAIAADGRTLATTTARVRALRAGKRSVGSGGSIGGSVWAN